MYIDSWLLFSIALFIAIAIVVALKDYSWKSDNLWGAIQKGSHKPMTNNTNNKEGKSDNCMGSKRDSAIAILGIKFFSIQKATSFSVL